jgi:hypothetical protein
MGVLATFVWKIPDIERTGISSYRIESAKGVLLIVGGTPSDHEGWIYIAECLFTAFTGGRKEYWKDFEYAFWKWLEWLWIEEDLPDENKPEFPNLVKPHWWPY